MFLLFTDDIAFGKEIAYRLRLEDFWVTLHDPDLALSICDRVDFGGVILDGRQNPRRMEALSEALIRQYPELPLAFLSRYGDSVLPYATRVIRIQANSEILPALMDFCQTYMLSQSDYSTYALQYNKSRKEFTYLGYPLPLSDYERRFLLCLFRCAPSYEKTDVLLSVAFPDSQTPRTTLCTLSSRINKLSKSISGLRLIQTEYGKGYRLCGGIVPTPNTKTGGAS